MFLRDVAISKDSRDDDELIISETVNPVEENGTTSVQRERIQSVDAFKRVTSIFSAPKEDDPPMFEDGGILEDLDFPGYRMPAWTGLGKWRFSAARKGWVLLVITNVIFLGMCGGLWNMAGDVVLLNHIESSGIYGVALAMFIKAFFKCGIFEGAYKFIIICTCRSLRQQRQWNNELFLLTIWAMVGFATFDQVLITVTGSSDLLGINPGVQGLQALMAVRISAILFFCSHSKSLKVRIPRIRIL